MSSHANGKKFPVFNFLQISECYTGEYELINFMVNRKKQQHTQPPYPQHSLRIPDVEFVLHKSVGNFPVLYTKI